MKMPTASVISAPASASPSRNRISMASMLRTKLSLNAEKNWHQNKGAKRRLRIRAASVARSADAMLRRAPSPRRLGVADDAADGA